VVYSDSLENGFQDWSWSSSYSLSSSAPVHSGSYSIEFAVQNFQALYFHSPAPLPLGSYSSIQFYVNGGSSSIDASNFLVLLYDSNENLIGNSVWPAGPSAGTWTLVSVLTSSFGVATATTEISGFALQANTDDSLGNIWIDDISLQLAVTTAATTSTTGSSCGASSILIDQSVVTSWVQGSTTIVQWAVTVSSTCSTFTLSALTLSATNWNPIDSWGVNVAGTSLTLPSYASVTSSSPFTGFGYQNQGSTAAVFTVASYSFL